MKKGLKITLIVISSILLALIIFLIFALINHKAKNNVKVESKIENTTGLVEAKGRGLYDINGDELVLKGVNLGAMFVTEGWISPYATKDMVWNNDSNHYDYTELSHEQFLSGFYSNSNLTDNQRKELLEIYYENFFNDNDAKLIIAGKGGMIDELKAQVDFLGLGNKVYFTGYLNSKQVQKMYKCADISVFPSTYEPFGIVALEAMLAGTPVVVSDIGGLNEIEQRFTSCD